MRPEYIVVHTAAFRGANCDSDLIDRWHRGRGWNGIGHHFVILNDRHHSKADGSVEPGRPVGKTGAHAYGINSRSLGICCVGHGDFDDFTPAQYSSLFNLIARLMRDHGIPISNVIGHREINRLVDQEIIDAQYRTSKSCPGNRIDMDAMRLNLQRHTTPGRVTAVEPAVSAAELQNSLKIVADSAAMFPNANDVLLQFLNHPEIIELMEVSQ